MTPEEFVIAWQSSTTQQEVEKKTGLKYNSAKQRAKNYRKMGVPLKKIRAAKGVGAPRLDWESLKTLAIATQQGKESTGT